MLNVALFVLSLGLTGLFTRAVLRWLGPDTWADFLLAASLVAVSYVVLTGELAGLLHVLNLPIAYLGIQFGLLAILHLIRRIAHGPHSFAFPRRSPRDYLSALKSDPFLVVFAAVIAGGYLFSAVLILTVPQNNMDALSTHLARVGHWLQNATFLPWSTPRTWQVIYPYNAQLVVIWPVLFLQNDLLVGFPQWFSALVSAVAVAGIAMELGASQRAALYAALTFLTFPLIVLQSSTAQTDLIVMAPFVMAVYFLLRGFRQRRMAFLVLSALALGLGIGVKQTFFFLLPSLGVILLVSWRHYHATNRALLMWLTCSLVATLVLGTMSYAVNWATFGHPLGPPQVVAESSGKLQAEDILPKIGYNAFRLFYQSLDTSGLPRPVDGYAHKAKMRLFQWLFRITGWQVEGDRYTFPAHPFSLAFKNQAEESHAWYGPLSALLLYPAMLYALWTGLRDRQLKAAFPLAFALFAIVEILARPGWDPYQGRYFAGVFALNAPLMAVLFEDSPRHKTLRRVFRSFVVALSALILFVALTYNPSKPVLGKWADDIGIWTKDRIFLQTVQWKRERTLHYMIAEQVPDDATLGVYVPGYLLEYLLFGPHFTRHVVVIHPLERLRDTDWLREQHLTFLLLQPADPALLPPFCEEAARRGQYLLAHCIETEP